MVTINLTEQQISTVLTALKSERYRMEENKSERAKEALQYINNAIAAILNQPWKFRPY